MSVKLVASSLAAARNFLKSSHGILKAMCGVFIRYPLPFFSRRPYGKNL